MASMYAFLAGIAQSLGIFFFMSAFFLVVAYALWPRNGSAFRRAAETPLIED
jgi:cytochrome c oxidase cbb3-type subunit 4